MSWSAVSSLAQKHFAGACDSFYHSLNFGGEAMHVTPLVLPIERKIGEAHVFVA